jgi:hypothetical protein
MVNRSTSKGDLFTFGKGIMGGWATAGRKMSLLELVPRLIEFQTVCESCGRFQTALNRDQLNDHV